MRIWLINHYGVPPKYYPLARPTLFAKNLKKMGHEVIIFASSAVHNSDINLISDGSLYRKDTVDGIHYVYIKSRQYEGNGKQRVINLIEFANRLPSVCRHFRKPDAVVSTSFDPLSCYCGIKLAKKYGAKAIAEIADLWPETPVAYGLMKAYSPIVKGLRILEKKIYLNADAIIFTMERAYDYIIEQGWKREIPKEKAYYINNGVDLEEFDKNIDRYVVNDIDLNNKKIFKAVYTGAIRAVNYIDGILNVAKKIDDPDVVFLIWGDGEEFYRIQKRIENEKIVNVIMKGSVEKKYIPSILSRADVCLMHGKTSRIAKFGMSLNKSFDYLASGKPIITTFYGKDDYIVSNEAGLYVDSEDIEKYKDSIIKIKSLGRKDYLKMCKNARKTAENFDFKELTRKLYDIILT